MAYLFLSPGRKSSISITREEGKRNHISIGCRHCDRLSRQKTIATDDLYKFETMTERYFLIYLFERISKNELWVIFKN